MEQLRTGQRGEPGRRFVVGRPWNLTVQTKLLTRPASHQMLAAQAANRAGSR